MRLSERRGNGTQYCFFYEVMVVREFIVLGEISTEKPTESTQRETTRTQHGASVSITKEELVPCVGAAGTGGYLVTKGWLVTPQE